MEWSDRAIVLSQARYSEHAAIARFFTEQHGLSAAMVYGVSSRKARGLYQPGNILQITWRARVSEQIGHLAQADMLMAVPALIMHDALRLGALASACILTEASLAERHPESTLFSALLHLIEALVQRTDWQMLYVRYEAELLSACGYGLDLGSCAVTGEQAELAYVSPKTGRAVTRAGAGHYRNLLLPLPRFLCHADAEADAEQIRQGLALTGFFLSKWLFAARHGRLPAARQQFLALLGIA